MPRLIAGNLDCESDYAGSSRGLPGPVAELASALATLLRAFARDGDRLWTPRAIDPARVVAVPELPNVRLETGRLAAAEPAEDVLAWGETQPVAALRRADPGGPSALATRPLWRAVWDLPRAPPDAAARANHRALAFELSRELGCALPGARRVRSRDDLDAHIAAGGARAGRGAWVVKAPYGAAGRERVRRRGRDLGHEVQVRIDRLLARYGELIFEPWVERTADYGICGAVAAGETWAFPPHRLRCDRQGVIRAVEIDDDGAAPAGVREELERAARAAGRALDDAGYRGPFNVDAFTYRDEGGTPRVQPLCEINARLSLGFVTRALGERIAAPRGHSPGRVELRLGAETPGDRGAVPLLAAGGRDGAAAWLVMSRGG